MRIGKAKSLSSKYFYALDSRDARVVKLVGVLGLGSLFFAILGFLNFLRISPVILVVFSPILTVITLYNLIQFALMVLYPGFDIREHRRKVAAFKAAAVPPRVAVFVPAAGEDIAIVRETIMAALAIDYPDCKVFLLDDSKNAVYKGLAEELGCVYVRRKVVGLDKKAGNMNHALHRVDGYDWVLILDADFKARPEILRELVPYTADDVGIVQSPQHFPMNRDVHKRSKIEYGAAYIQQDFYRITQVSRDRFGAAICVGTNALYNVKAVRQVGGWEGVGASKGWGHSEDVNTGLKIINTHNADGNRYWIKYVPIQLAEGYCPDTHYTFYKQQNRWCTGSMQLLFSGKTLFSRALSVSQRLIYGSSSLYYYATICVLLSPAYLLTITLLNNQPQWKYTFYFLPSVMTNLVIAPFLLRKQYRPLAAGLVVLSNAYTFLQALYLLIRQRPLGWEASGVKQAGRSTHFTQFKLSAYACFLLLYITTFGALLLNDKLRFGPSIIIIGVFFSSLFAHIGFLYYMLVVDNDKDKRYKDRKFYAAVAMAVLLVAVGTLGYAYHTTYHVGFGKDDIITFEKQHGPVSGTAAKVVAGTSEVSAHDR
jgi:cellulose synthase/poly-beta-1,6-N-acetylglucosamine synthase-like glycosyltransferase